MSAAAIQAGEAFVELRLKTKEFQAKLNEASEKLIGFGNSARGKLEILNKALSGSLKALQPIAPAISALGVSLEGLSVGVGIIGDLGGVLATLRMNILATSTAVWEFTAALMANPLTAFCAILAATITTLAAVGLYFLTSESAASKAAKATEELRKQHDEFRESARQSADIIDKLTKKQSLNADDISTSKNAWMELKRNAEALGHSLDDLGISYDENSGKINAAAGAMAKFRELMRVQEMEELNAEIKAQGEYLDELTAKLHNGKEGWGRYIGEWVTLGIVDNAEEIQQKIDETRKKLRENTKRQSEVADFSAAFREAEKQLEAFQAKDEEATRNATQNKIAAIQKEFAERKAILNQLIEEASARATLSKEERKQLEERKKALDELNKKQQKRIALLKEEEEARILKIRADYEEKKKADANEKEWKKKLEKNSSTALEEAKSSSIKADNDLKNAEGDRLDAERENKTPQEIAALDKALEKARADAEMWNRRKEEAEAKVKDDASKRKKELEDAKKQRTKELEDVEDSRRQKEKAREAKVEEQAWKDKVEKDSDSARQEAATKLAENQGALNAAYENLQNLIRTGASEKEKKAAKENVAQVEANIDKWQSRVDNLQIGRIPKQTTSPVTNPAAMMAGSAEAQRKFLENRNAKNPMDETNALLEQVVKEQRETKEHFRSMESV